MRGEHEQWASARRRRSSQRAAEAAVTRRATFQTKQIRETKQIKEKQSRGAQRRADAREEEAQLLERGDGARNRCERLRLELIQEREALAGLRLCANKTNKSKQFVSHKTKQRKEQNK